ncbi:MAG TPA: hypothetical protein VGD01_19660 [Candidatus Elarobacter sp.]
MTIVPAPAPVRFEAILSRTWALFKPNWTIALPPLIATIVIVAGAAALGAASVVAAVGAAATRGSHGSEGLVAGLIVAVLVYVIAASLLAMWGVLAMYGMADAVWTRGSATFADGNAAFFSRFGAMLVAFVGMIGIVFAALILAIPTLGLALIAMPLMTMYVLPAVVSGHRGGFEAIGESFRLVRRFFVPSALTLLILYAIAYGLGFVGAIGIVPLEFSMIGTSGNSLPVFPPVPLLVICGTFYFASILLSVIYSGFQALALVGLYHDLIAQPEYVPPAGPYPPPAPIVPG